MAKRHTVAEIKADYINLVRNAILGQKVQDADRPGLNFHDNGMRVVEVEVLDLSLSDTKIAQLLDQAQHKVVQTNIEIDGSRKDLEATKEKERIAQETAETQYETIKLKTDLKKKSLTDEIELVLTQISVELKKLEGEKEKALSREDTTDLVEARKLERAKLEHAHIMSVDQAKADLEKFKVDAVTDAAVKRLEASKEGLHEALVAINRDDIAAKLSEACNIERYITGDSLSSSVSNILAFFPGLQGLLDTPGLTKNNRLKETPTLPANK
jgi:major vault protein